MWLGKEVVISVDMSRKRRKGCDGAAHTYIADIHLCFLYSQHLWIVCNLSVWPPFALLIVVLIVNLHDKQHVVSHQKQCQSTGAGQTSVSESHR